LLSIAFECRSRYKVFIIFGKLEIQYFFRVKLMLNYKKRKENF
jgi:hypothetical protein